MTRSIQSGETDRTAFGPLSEFTPAALLAWLSQHGIDAELLRPGVPMPTVPLAAQAIGVVESQIIKTLLFEDRSGNMARVIASGPTRIALGRLAGITNLQRPRLARPQTVLEVTGWPAGGVAPVGSRIPLPTTLEQRVLAFDWVYGGGGTEDTLIRLRPSDIAALTDATIAQLTDIAG